MPSPAVVAPRRSVRRRPWCLAAVIALAVAMRLAHVWSLRGTPWFDLLVVDPEYYDAWAREIAAGNWLGDRAFFMDPLYPYVLAVLYKLWGHHLLLPRLLNVGCSAAACACVAALGRRVGGATIGLLAALGFALYKPEIFYVGEVDKTCLSVLLMSATLAFGLRRSPAARFGAGIALGLAALTRANFLLFVPLGALLAWRTRGRALAGTVLFVAGVTLVLAPVMWRNHHVSGEWGLTTANLGQNFYIGNNPFNPSGAYGALPFIRANPHLEEIDFHNEAEARVGHPLSAGEVSGFWFAQALEHMRTQPLFAAGVMARKLALFWNDFEVSDNQDQDVLARDCWVLRLPLLGFGWIAPLALLGALVGIRSRRAVRVLVVFIGLYYASVVAFFIFSRYRIQTVPALLPLAALGLSELVARARSMQWATLAAEVAGVAAAALLCFHTIGIFSAGNELVIEMRLRHFAGAYLSTGHPERGIAALQEAVNACPLHCHGALQDLADAYLANGRLAEGEAYFGSFTHAHPERAVGWRNLVRLFDAEGKRDDAAAAARHAERLGG